MNFLKPTKKKIIIYSGILVFVVVWSWFFFEINERDIAGIVLIPLLSVPYATFDAITFSYFAPQCNGFIWCFPTVPEMIFVAVFDLAVLYIISCAIAAFTGKKKIGTN